MITNKIEESLARLIRKEKHQDASYQYKEWECDIVTDSAHFKKIT